MTPHSFNMLVPQAYEVAWTQLVPDRYGGVEALNDRPPGPVTPQFDAQASVTVTVAIPSVIQTHKPIVPYTARRTFLLIENNSSGTGAPTLFVALGVRAIAFNPMNAGCIALQPGQGFVFDRHVPLDAVYVAWGTSTGTPIIGGTLVQGVAPLHPQPEF